MATIAQRVDEDADQAERSDEEQLMVDSPESYAAAAAQALALDPGDPARQQALRLNILSGWAALSRGDLELLVVRYADDLIAEFDERFNRLSKMPTRIEGLDAYRAALVEWRGDWAGYRLKLESVIDSGGRVVALGSIAVTGPSSGVTTASPMGQILDSGDGLVTRERVFLDDHEKTLEAAGLDPSILPALEELSPGETLELAAR